MRLVLRYIVLSGLALTLHSFLFNPLLAQDRERCGTEQYSKALYPDHDAKKLRFEKWLTEKKSQLALQKHWKKQTSPYRIPVVVHVIHNGEPIGVGANISDAQILSQIRVLNEDFSRQNADAANTPAVFADVAAGLDIEFVLAKQDPEGLPTNGIVRVNGGRSGWTANDNYAMKSLSYWPAEDYMNIWVCNLVDSYVGYAQLPESELEGTENGSKNRLTDGVVIWHQAFGSIDDGAFSLDPVFNKGRTTTHETGHFFGLLHIWGDDSGCNGTDYVEDTPNQANRTQGCPSHPRKDACSDIVMFQNFLDYTNDACMNLFTQGQIERMSIVIENSPRRNSLLTSPGLFDPSALPIDLGIRNIVSPGPSICSNQVRPTIEVKNYGTNPITSAQIRFALDGDVIETLDFPLALSPEESEELQFTELTMSSGTHDLKFEVLLVNGSNDLGTNNNEFSSTVLIPHVGSAPFTIDFSTQPSGWFIQNFDGQITWEIATAPKETGDNKALKLNYFDYEDNLGEVDVFLSPVFDLSSAPAAMLTFDVAYARYVGSGSNDRLDVVVLTDCQGIFEGNTVYSKSGNALRTANSISSPFTPVNSSEWRREFINLSDFIGLERVQLAFVGINDWGNNIYIDNISLDVEERLDAALISVSRPSPVTCQQDVSPKITVANEGSIPIVDLDVSLNLNGQDLQGWEFTAINLAPGLQTELEIPTLSLAAGNNTLTVGIRAVNTLEDVNLTNNELTYEVIVDNHSESIPLRQDFEHDFFPAWTVTNPSPTTEYKWELTNTNFGQSLYYNGFDNDAVGEQSWFVSPVLDFSDAESATMVFDVSYSPTPGEPSEALAVLASDDCGLTYRPVDFTFSPFGTSNQAWVPSHANHWSSDVDIDLNAYAGKKNVRIAFVVTNQNSNNLYLDNIEFFLSPDPPEVEPEKLFSIYGYNLEHPELSDLQLTFNLPERQDVRFIIINALGQVEADGIIGNVLNQTFPLELRSRLKPGVYFVKLIIGGKAHITKVLVH